MSSEKEIRNGKDVAGDPDDAETVSVYNEEDSKCGLGTFKPDWLQKMASKKVFIVIFGLLGMNEIAVGSYFVGTISTIEKRFKLPSSTTGMISSSWDAGATVALIFIAYYGGTGHKTRWVARCSIFAGIACFMIYLPHLIFGPGELYTSPKNMTSGNSSYLSYGNLCSDPNQPVENCSLNSEGRIALIILICAYLLLGVGTSSYYTLGAAYLDDNVMKNKFPFLFALVACIRYVGPTLGYLTSSYTLSTYVDPNVTPDFTQEDPRWIGAWYKAWIPFGTIEMTLALGIAFFPRLLPREADRRKQNDNMRKTKKKQSLQDFKETIGRLLKNPVLMFNTFSSTFYVFGLMGYWIFMPKYIETQFRQTASKASLITGTVGLVCTAVGVVSSGAVISKFKPRPRYLAAWNVFTELIDVIGHISFAYIGCFKEDFHGSYNDEGSWDLIKSCNSNCSCSTNMQYTPVCSYDNKTTFYSPCHAGCLTSTIADNGAKIFSNCSCIGGLGQAVDGACPVECENQFYIFLVILCFMKFLSSTGRSGNTIIQYRSVAPEDKAISIAFTEVILAVITFIPSPIIYGLLLDSSCLVWGQTCGKTGNCWLYHGKELRYLLNFTSSAFLLLGTLLDIGVLYNVGSLQIYDEVALNEEQTKSDKDNEQPLLDLKPNSANHIHTENANS
ncbi:solute carrier organic anion transporter family member 1C1-like isoform X1 [Cimex lectularius]|uniref:Solute carrier organic anion transporter family member n=1 Tax=Cimex lectularius TaxID=79782 RepID=A0A8I6TFA9_CIMLE|nr:solute carrier organic anion transporter family member 1C1-like isoform X1 [Cimex lectularius]